MKVEINKSQLLNGLNFVQNIVGSRSTLPILSNVLIRADGSHLQLTTTDLDLFVRCSVPAKISKTGAITLPVRKLAGIVRELSSEEIQFEADQKNVGYIRCGSSSFKIIGLAAEEFPTIPKLEKAKTQKFLQAQLKEILKRTTFAISADETRYVLNGLLFSLKSNKLVAVATDGRRLALVENEQELAKENEQDAIIPSKAVLEVARVLADSGDVRVELTENQVAFEFNSPKGSKGKEKENESDAPPSNEGVLIISKLIVGNFPNYKQVIPTETKERISLERESLLSSLHRASLLTSDKSSAVKLQFSKNLLTISANSPDVGEAKETLAVKYTGKDLAIAFNPQFLMEPLRNLDTDEVFLELIDELSPGVLKINGAFLYVVMPLRLN